MERWSERKSMQPVYGDNASRNTVNHNLSECLISSNSLIVIREGSTEELVIAKEVCILNIRLQLNLSKKKKKLTAFCFYCSLFWCRRYWMKHLWPKRSKSAFPAWELMVRCRTSLNFESKCTLYQSKHYSNFSWSQSTQFVSPHKKFDVPIKTLFFRRF